MICRGAAASAAPPPAAAAGSTLQAPQPLPALQHPASGYAEAQGSPRRLPEPMRGYDVGSGAPALPEYPPFKVYLGNIPYEIDEEMVTHFFHGLEVRSSNRRSNSSRGWQQQEWRPQTAAAAAISCYPVPCWSCQKLHHTVAPRVPAHTRADVPCLPGTPTHTHLCTHPPMPRLLSSRLRTSTSAAISTPASPRASLSSLQARATSATRCR